MRLIIARALTPALATAGIAWAIVLPTLTLGEAKTPSHAFATPAPSGDLLIEASRLPETATARAAPPAAPRPAPSAVVVVVTAPAPNNVPAAEPPAAAPLPTPIQTVPKVLPIPPPTPTPVPTPEPAPEPAPAPLPSPAEPSATPKPLAMRTLASVSVAQPDEDAGTASKKHKQHKDKSHPNRPKPATSEQCDDTALPLPQADPETAPPATVDPLVPVEPLAVEETERHADGKHDGNGKEHDKKK
jgi:hypothetical protein